MALAGLSYCAIGALAFVDRLPDSVQNRPKTSSDDERRPLTTGISSLKGTLRWLVSRQRIEDDDDEDDEDDGGEDFGYRAAPGQVFQAHEFQHAAHGTYLEDHHKLEQSDQGNLLQRLPPHVIPSEHGQQHPLIAGFNGRCNKTTDTCYSFWVGGSLSVSLLLPNFLPSSPTPFH